MQRLFGIMKIILYKALFSRNIKFNSLLKLRIGKNLKIVVEDDSSIIKLGSDISCRDYITFRLSGGELVIGNGVFFNSFVSINCMKKIVIGNNCLFGENVKIYDHNHIFNEKKLIKEQGFKCKEIKIGNNVWIGSNCVILKGVNIGDNVVIGAGTIVRKDIPSETVIYSDSIIHSSPIIYR